jgi:hypothetical protein
MPHPSHQPSAPVKTAASAKPSLPPVKSDYPPTLRRQMLVRLMSKLGKRQPRQHT